MDPMNNEKGDDSLITLITFNYVKYIYFCYTSIVSMD